MTRMGPMFSMRSTRLTHSLISISRGTRVSSLSTPPPQPGKDQFPVERLRIPGKGVSTHPPTPQPFPQQK